MSNTKFPHGLFTQAEVDYAERLVESGECSNVKDAAEKVKSERVAPAAFQNHAGDGDWSGIDLADGDGRVAAQSFPKPEADESVGEAPSIGNTEQVAEILASDQDALTADAFIDEEGFDADAAAEYDAERVEEAEAEAEKKGRRK